MALIDGKKFSKITQNYGFESDVLDEVTCFIYKNCELKETMSVSRCVVEVLDLAKRRIIPRKQIRYFDLVFSYYSIPKYKPESTKTYIHIVFEAAEELTKEEFERRKEALSGEEVLRKAKEIINPVYKTK